MKIAVYTIAKNEEKFVRRWYESSKDADYHLILDTGSTDGTLEIAKSLGIHIEIKDFVPWRFDSARNHALSMLPDDIDLCISLDLDEVLSEGWRQEVEKASDMASRFTYKYVWSHKEDGTEDVSFNSDKCHSRHGYTWKYPVHEVLHYLNGQEVFQHLGFQINHYPDESKSRAQYLPLLKMAVYDNPKDSRTAFYYARELYFNSKFKQSEKEFIRYLKLDSSTWRAERSKAMRYLNEITGDIIWLWRAVSEAPDRREGWMDLANIGYADLDWPLCFYASSKALAIEERPMDYLNESFAWGELPHDLNAISSYYLGWKENAIKHGTIALSMKPDDQRLKDNMKFYSQL
jgi:glycosyltransferase involved in cell wall biosynthesis